MMADVGIPDAVRCPGADYGNGLSAVRWLPIGAVRDDLVAGVLDALREAGVAARAAVVGVQSDVPRGASVSIWVDRARSVRADNVLMSELAGGGRPGIRLREPPASPRRSGGPTD